jgi:predicted regulator of Ras-like GTPase activity (Roadblock/LC7/MglB family)
VIEFQPANVIDSLLSGTDELTVEVSSTSRTAVVSAIFSHVIEGASRTFIQWVRLVASFVYGDGVPGTGTQAYRDEADTKNRLQATVSADGTRTMTTIDGDES